jgi:hypothetical protein
VGSQECAVSAGERVLHDVGRTAAGWRVVDAAQPR